MSRRTHAGVAGLLEGLSPSLRLRNAATLDALDRTRLVACPPAERPALARDLATHATRQRAGKVAQAAGSELEAWLDGQHAALIAAGILARMRHVDPPTRETRVHCPHCDGWHPGIVRTGDGPADYQGQLVGGRAVAVEAKSRTKRLYLVGDLEPHQVADLGACARAGGLAVLVYEHRRPDGSGARRFAIPWLEVPWDRRHCAGSIGPADVTRWEVPAGAPYLAPLLGCGPGLGSATVDGMRAAPGGVSASYPTDSSDRRMGR